MQKQPEQDIWDWQPEGPVCTGKHVWVYYISMQIRECVCCPTREALWADFGMVKLLPPE